MTPDRTRKTRKASTSFKREGVVLRYAAQSVCRATFDADVAAEEVDDDVEATVDVFARLDAPAVLGVAGACFAGVLGPAIPFFFLRLSLCDSVEENVVSVVVVVKSTCPKRRSLDHTQAVPGSQVSCPFGNASFRTFPTASSSSCTVSHAASSQQRVAQKRQVRRRG
jgi:hypothetical protein